MKQKKKIDLDKLPPFRARTIALLSSSLQSLQIEAASIAAASSMTLRIVTPKDFFEFAAEEKMFVDPSDKKVSERAPKDVPRIMTEELFKSILEKLIDSEILEWRKDRFGEQLEDTSSKAFDGLLVLDGFSKASINWAFHSQKCSFGFFFQPEIFRKSEEASDDHEDHIDWSKCIKENNPLFDLKDFESEMPFFELPIRWLKNGAANPQFVSLSKQLLAETEAKFALEEELALLKSKCKIQNVDLSFKSENSDRILEELKQKPKSNRPLEILLQICEAFDTVYQDNPEKQATDFSSNRLLFHPRPDEKNNLNSQLAPFTSYNLTHFIPLNRQTELPSTMRPIYVAEPLANTQSSKHFFINQSIHTQEEVTSHSDGAYSRYFMNELDYEGASSPKKFNIFPLAPSLSSFQKFESSYKNLDNMIYLKGNSLRVDPLCKQSYRFPSQAWLTFNKLRINGKFSNSIQIKSENLISILSKANYDWSTYLEKLEPLSDPIKEEFEKATIGSGGGKKQVLEIPPPPNHLVHAAVLKKPPSTQMITVFTRENIKILTEIDPKFVKKSEPDCFVPTDFNSLESAFFDSTCSILVGDKLQLKLLSCGVFIQNPERSDEYGRVITFDGYVIRYLQNPFEGIEGSSSIEILHPSNSVSQFSDGQWTTTNDLGLVVTRNVPGLKYIQSTMSSSGIAKFPYYRAREDGVKTDYLSEKCKSISFKDRTTFQIDGELIKISGSHYVDFSLDISAKKIDVDIGLDSTLQFSDGQKGASLKVKVPGRNSFIFEEGIAKIRVTPDPDEELKTEEFHRKVGEQIVLFAQSKLTKRLMLEAQFQKLKNPRKSDIERYETSKRELDESTTTSLLAKVAELNEQFTEVPVTNFEFNPKIGELRVQSFFGEPIVANLVNGISFVKHSNEYFEKTLGILRPTELEGESAELAALFTELSKKVYPTTAPWIGYTFDTSQRCYKLDSDQTFCKPTTEKSDITSEEVLPGVFLKKFKRISPTLKLASKTQPKTLFQVFESSELTYESSELIENETRIQFTPITAEKLAISNSALNSWNIRFAKEKDIFGQKALKYSNYNENYHNRSITKLVQASPNPIDILFSDRVIQEPVEEIQVPQSADESEDREEHIAGIHIDLLDESDEFDEYRLTRGRTKLTNEMRLKENCSRFISNYFESYEGVIYIQQNPLERPKNCLSQEETNLIQDLMSRAIDKDIDDCFGENACSSEISKGPETAKDTAIPQKKKFKITKSYYRSEIEEREKFERDRIQNENDMRMKKTKGFDIMGNSRKNLPLVRSLYTTAAPISEKNEQRILREGPTDRRTRTCSQHSKLHFLAFSTSEVRATGPHRDLERLEDLSIPPDFLEFKKTLMPISQINDPKQKDLIIYPSTIDFGVVDLNQYYEAKLLLVNEDVMMNRFIVKPPQDCSRIFLVKQEGPLAPGMQRIVKIQFDTANIASGLFKTEITVTTQTRTYTIPVRAEVKVIDLPTKKTTILDEKIIDSRTSVKKLEAINEEFLKTSQLMTSQMMPKLYYDENFHLTLTKPSHVEKEAESPVRKETTA